MARCFSFVFFLVCVCSRPIQILAQRIKLPVQYTAEAGVFVSSSNQTPFWLRSNQNGIVPLTPSALTFRLSAKAEYDTARKHKLDYGYGLNAVANTVGTNQVLLPEAYLKIRYRAFEIYGGRQREMFGLTDSTLSTGAYAWSGNALPIPKIQIGIPVFTPLPFTKKWVSIMGQYAHGWLGGTYVEHTMLHQKSFYMKIGKTNSRVQVSAGFNHQVMWGGYSPALAQTLLNDGPYLPATFRDYVYVVTGYRAGGGIDRTDGLTSFDYANRVGNHLGSIDLAINVRLKKFSLYAYRQSVYDDGSLFYLTNIADGLHGLRIRMPKPDALVHDLLFEFLNTTSQGGALFSYDGGGANRGNDNYFNHGQFRDGWSYQGQAIGTPFITPERGADGKIPFGVFSNNNRVRVFHVGMSGTLPKFSNRLFTQKPTYQAKFSYSQNLGLYTEPFLPIKPQFSSIVTVLAPVRWLNGAVLTASVSADVGKLYPTTFGGYLGVRKYWQRKLPIR
jgi:hypothetical protein